MTAEPEKESRAAEIVLEPDLPICDPHHHLRERPNDRYFLEEFFKIPAPGTISWRPFAWKIARCIAWMVRDNEAHRRDRVLR